MPAAGRDRSGRRPVASLRAGRNFDRGPKTARMIDDKAMQIKELDTHRPTRPAGNENRVLSEAAGKLDEGMARGSVMGRGLQVVIKNVCCSYNYIAQTVTLVNPDRSPSRCRRACALPCRRGTSGAPCRRYPPPLPIAGSAGGPIPTSPGPSARRWRRVRHSPAADCGGKSI